MSQGDKESSSLYSWEMEGVDSCFVGSGLQIDMRYMFKPFEHLIRSQAATLPGKLLFYICV